MISLRLLITIVMLSLLCSIYRQPSTSLTTEYSCTVWSIHSALRARRFHGYSLISVIETCVWRLEMPCRTRNPLRSVCPRARSWDLSCTAMFTKPIGEICRRHNMSYHCYADDTQVYIVIRPLDNWNNYRVRLEACLSDISKWMSSNMLKLNHDKTELVVFAPCKSARDLADIRLTFDGCVIKPVPVVKNLGAYFDAALSMDSHVCAVAKSCYFQIRNIGRIRHLIDEETCKTLIHALVTSRLDYANALLVGLPCSATNKLQRVQNTAARMVTRTKKHDHITPVLIDLHWLPVQFRIQFKVLVHTYKAVHRQGPVYLSELIIPYCPPRTLRSENGMLLNVPRTRTKLYGNRRFDFSASTLWNALPLDLRRAKSLDIFKQNLKTHLFKSAFNA